MATDASRYGVFIIESIDSENERLNHFDGATLKAMLDLCGIANEYIFIRTKLELEYAASEFEESGLAFLHIACHGNQEALHLALEHVTFAEIEEIFGDALYHRRLFLSACEAGCFDLAKQFVPKHHTYSVIGTPDTIQMDKAALFWSTFYYMMYSVDDQRMFQRNILPILENVTRFFSIRLNYFSIIKNEHSRSHDSLNHFLIENGHTTNTVRATPFLNIHRPDCFPAPIVIDSQEDEDDASI